jgi:hypothetical protein
MPDAIQQIPLITHEEAGSMPIAIFRKLSLTRLRNYLSLRRRNKNRVAAEFWLCLLNAMMRSSLAYSRKKILVLIFERYIEGTLT